MSSSERKKRHEITCHDALRDGKVSDGCFRAVAACSCDWESWHAPDGRLIWVNSAVERVTGYSPAECLAMEDYPLQLISAADHQRIAEMLQDAKAGGHRNDLEFQSRHRSGEMRWMAMSWQPMYNVAGQHLGFRTSIRDINERRTLRDQIRLHAEHLEQLVQERTARVQQLEHHRRQMEKLAALGQLAAGIAHEVNNPLAGIRNAFELIKADLTPDHEHFELLELIDREIERISSIIHQIYQLYRRSPQAANEFEIERTLAEIVTLLGSVARKHQIQLKTESIGRATSVLLPEGEVKQILYNLICNAIQASPVREIVTIRIEHNGSIVHVSVVDRGAGIDDDILPHIFKPFFTTKGSQPRSGMGLGLSVSRNLIESMGGSIKVDTSRGKGSRFTAEFPVRLERSAEDSHD